jgi:hypothetical protein
MPLKITVPCAHCQMEYTVPDFIVGKRVTCKKCGQTFLVPQPAKRSEDQPVDLNALEELEPVGYVPPPITAPQLARARAMVAPAFSTGTSVDGVPLMYAPPIKVKRRWNMPGPLDDLIHDKLPVLLILLGYVLPVTLSFIQAFRNNMRGIVIFGMVVFLVGFLSIAIPITVTGLRIAANAMSFELVPSPGYRIMASFSAASIAMFIYSIVSKPVINLHETPVEIVSAVVLWLLGGLAIGVLASFALVWLFFRLEFGQAIVTWLIAGFSYIIGNVVTFLVTAMAIGVVAYAFPGTVGITTNQTPSDSTPADTGIDMRRDQTAVNLRSLNSYIQDYNITHGKYCPTLQDFQMAGMPHSEVISPYGPVYGDSDYEYLPFTVSGDVAGHDWILAYDKAELGQEHGTTVLRGDGAVEYLDADRLNDALANARLYATAEFNRVMAARFAPPAPTVVNPPQPPQPPAPPDTSKPPDQSAEDADPAIPAYAWTAQVDAPAALTEINPRIRVVFNGNVEFFFSPQPGNWMVANGLPDTMGNIRVPPVAELWNLKTLTKVDHFEAIHEMQDVILSPDGKHLAGRALGGAGEATAYEVWSPRTGKLEQTLATPPIGGTAMPKPVGFFGDDMLLTADDEFNVWDLKSGARVRTFGEHLTFDAKTLCAPSPTGKLAAVLSGDDQTISLVSVASGKTLGQSPLPDRHARQTEIASDERAVAFSPDGKEIAAFVNGRHIYVWSVVDGSLAGSLDLLTPIEGVLSKHERNLDTLVWLPDSQSWMIGGDRIIDRATGICIYNIPKFDTADATEFGQRRVIDTSHLLLQFHANMGNKSAVQQMPIDGKIIEKTRAALRADVSNSTTTPATAPATQP